MSQKQQKNRQVKSGLKKELKSYDKQGIELWLNGDRSTPKEILKACMVQEAGTYMRDYVTDEKGAIREIRFDLIRKE